MKIVILQGAFLPVPPKLGGAVEKMWFALGKEFAKLGHEAVHISRLYPNLPSNEEIEGVSHIRVKGFEMPSRTIFQKTFDFVYSLRALQKLPEDVDIIITNTFWAPILMSQAQKSKCMVDVQRMPKGQMRFYQKVSCLRANSKVVSNAIKSEIHSHKHEIVKIIPNPLPFKNKTEIKLSKKRHVILYAGRIHPEKGLEILIEAFKYLNLGWVLKIMGPWKEDAGGGGRIYLEKLKSFVEGYNVEFYDPIFDMELLNKYYEEAAIFAYPSVAEKGETFGLAPLEAMSWGCVPVVSALECFEDFIVHGSNGMTFNHRQKNSSEELAMIFQTLMNDAEYRNRLASHAQDVRKSHSLTLIASRFLQHFSSMIESRN